MSTKKFTKMAPGFAWAVVSASGKVQEVAMTKSLIPLLEGERYQRVRVTSYTPSNQQKETKKVVKKSTRKATKKGGSK